MESILPLIKQVMPIVSIVAVSNIGAFVYIKLKNNNNKIEIMDVKSEIRKIKRITQIENDKNKLF